MQVDTEPVSGPIGIGSSEIEFEPFGVEVHPERDTVRVAPTGELDLAVAPQLRDRLEELVDAGFRSVVLDLRGLTFIDSSGLHLILDWNARASERQVAFEIVQGPRFVRRAFELAGLADRLPFRASTTGETGATAADAAHTGMPPQG